MWRNKNLRLNNNLGYTIIETMIFLAVTSAMFIMAMLFLSGQQSKNEFSTGIRDIQSRLSDVINDASTGYYNNSGNFVCDTTSPGVPNISPGTADQGSNADCIFLGRAIQFDSSESGNETLELYTLVARRLDSTTGADVRDLAQAAPKVLDEADAELTLPYGITIASVSYAGGPINTGTIAFVSRLAGNTGSGGITGTQDIDLIGITGTVFGQSQIDAKNAIQAGIAGSPRNPSSGITLCFNSGGTNQHGIIQLGGSNRQNSISLTIESGLC